MKSFSENLIGLVYVFIYVFGFFYEPFFKQVYSIFGEASQLAYIIGLFLWIYIGYIFAKRKADKEEKREFKDMMKRIKKRERAFKRKKIKKKKK